jgi:hypothetical protein
MHALVRWQWLYGESLGSCSRRCEEQPAHQVLVLLRDPTRRFVPARGETRRALGSDQ